MKNLFLFAAAFLVSWSFGPGLSAGTIHTVLGPIEASQLGRTLEHEHILVDFIGAEETGYHRWNKEEVKERVLPFLIQAKDLGFSSIFECTPAYLGRDPLLLKDLSELTGLNLITNTGYYGARKNQFIPKAFQQLSADDLAQRWIQEFEHGIEATGIRPGFIKIGIDRDGDSLTAFHERLLRAAARTHLETGLTIACHTGPSPVIFQMESILAEEGVAQEALIWVHATRAPIKDQLKAAHHGLWVSIDNVRGDRERIDLIVESLEALKFGNLLDRVLLSHDAGWYRPGEENGGNFRPYNSLSENLIPALKAKGFKQREIDLILIENPKTAFGIQIRSAGK